MCREHYTRHFKEHPIDSYLDNKQSLVEWCVLMHNEVNKVTNKPEIETAELVKEYLAIYATNDPPASKQRKAAEYIYSKLKDNPSDVSSSSSSWGVVIGMVILLVIVGGGSYYCIQKQKNH